jgi:hypothetical protein
MRRLEERVAALESRPPAAPPAQTKGATADVIALEERLAAVEQRLMAGEGEAPAAGAGAPAAAPDARLDERRGRRERLRDVTNQYRDRLAAIRQETNDPLARQQAVREALQWYRDSRRAVLAGEEPEPLDSVRR